MLNHLDDYLHKTLSAFETSAEMAASFTEQWVAEQLDRFKMTLNMMHLATSFWNETVRQTVEWAAASQKRTLDGCIGLWTGPAGTEY